MSSVWTPQHFAISERDMAEHSRCHPGRPRPNGASHAAPTCSSSASALFHNAKSLGSPFAYSSLVTRAPTLISRVSRREGRLREGRRMLDERLAGLARRLDRAVVHVGEIHDLKDVVADVLQPTAQQI